jgi:hypothetical protein
MGGDDQIRGARNPSRGEGEAAVEALALPSDPSLADLAGLEFRLMALFPFLCSHYLPA